MYKESWNLEDLQLVISTLLKERVFKYKGIFFLRPDAETKDPIHDDVNAFIRSSGGAFASAITRVGVNMMVSDWPNSPLAKAFSGCNYHPDFVTVVGIDNELFEPNRIANLQFTLAHELGHIANGDVYTNSPLAIDSPEYLKCECLADLFACNLLESVVQARMAYKFYIGKIKARLAIETNASYIKKIKGALTSMMIRKVALQFI